jgi:hypothetical protein
VDLVLRLIGDEHLQLLAIALVNLATAIVNLHQTRRVKRQVRSLLIRS